MQTYFISNSNKKETPLYLLNFKRLCDGKLKLLLRMALGKAQVWMFIMTLLLQSHILLFIGLEDNIN